LAGPAQHVDSRRRDGVQITGHPHGRLHRTEADHPAGPLHQSLLGHLPADDGHVPRLLDPCRAADPAQRVPQIVVQLLGEPVAVTALEEDLAVLEQHTRARRAVGATRSGHTAFVGHANLSEVTVVVAVSSALPMMQEQAGPRSGTGRRPALEAHDLNRECSSAHPACRLCPLSGPTAGRRPDRVIGGPRPPAGARSGGRTPMTVAFWEAMRRHPLRFAFSLWPLRCWAFLLSGTVLGFAVLLVLAALLLLGVG